MTYRDRFGSRALRLCGVLQCIALAQRVGPMASRLSTKCVFMISQFACSLCPQYPPHSAESPHEYCSTAYNGYMGYSPRVRFLIIKASAI